MMPSVSSSTTPKACLPEGFNRAQAIEDLNAWADKFWDSQIFGPMGIAPEEVDREVSRNLTFRALLLLAQEGALEVNGHTLAQAIHRVNQAGGEA